MNALTMSSVLRTWAVRSQRALTFSIQLKQEIEAICTMHRCVLRLARMSSQHFFAARAVNAAVHVAWAAGEPAGYSRAGTMVLERLAD
jgi:hypothetical protein